MRVDRAELAGTGAAIAFHAALIAAMSLSLAHVVRPPETPSMEVELVDEVGLQPAAPASPATPPPSQAPEQGTEMTPAPPQPEPLPTPQITPTPQPRVAPQITPAPQPRPALNSLAAQAAELKAAPKRPATPPRAAPSRPTPATAAPRPRVSRIGDDFLKGIADAPASTTPARPAAPTFNAVAKTSVAAAIARQIQPCANRQPYIGEGVNQILLKLNLRLDRSGRLTQPPALVGSPSGVNDENARYVDVVKDQANRVFADCSPLRLPAELYQTPNGGWSNITINYKVK